uniref:BZIP domain-containing protein n=1 Tax=Romanomermis culicivorax TaxID=13658 RepID=A0A915KD24_ROMCU
NQNNDFFINNIYEPHNLTFDQLYTIENGNNYWTSDDIFYESSSPQNLASNVNWTDEFLHFSNNQFLPEIPHFNNGEQANENRDQLLFDEIIDNAAAKLIDDSDEQRSSSVEEIYNEIYHECEQNLDNFSDQSIDLWMGRDPDPVGSVPQDPDPLNQILQDPDPLSSNKSIRPIPIKFCNLNNLCEKNEFCQFYKETDIIEIDIDRSVINLPKASPSTANVDESDDDEGEISDVGGCGSARKKSQNRRAASRYRSRRKLARNFLNQERQELERKNSDLKRKVDDFEREIDYLKKFLDEIRGK